MTEPTLVLERELRSWSPPLRPPAFETADVAYVLTDTAVGRILMAQNDSGALVASRYVPDQDAEDALLDRLAKQVSPRVLRLPRALDEARRQLDDFLSGDRRSFDLATDLVLATPFQRSVLSTLSASVPYGERSSYGALARSAGRPTASRAVGAALGANPLCIVVPCHRVLGSGGSLTGYAGGMDAKRYLLQLEAAA